MGGNNRRPPGGGGGGCLTAGAGGGLCRLVWLLKSHTHPPIFTSLVAKLTHTHTHESFLLNVCDALRSNNLSLGGEGRGGEGRGGEGWILCATGHAGLLISVQQDRDSSVSLCVLSTEC